METKEKIFDQFLDFDKNFYNSIKYELVCPDNNKFWMREEDKVTLYNIISIQEKDKALMDATHHTVVNVPFGDSIFRDPCYSSDIESCFNK